MNAKQLAKFISEVVRQEIQEALPEIKKELMKEMLYEMHLNKRGNINEQEGSWEDSFEAELRRQKDEHIPEPLNNDDEGIYAQGGPIRRKNEGRSVASLLLQQTRDDAQAFKNEVMESSNALLDPSKNDMAHLYEGVKPIGKEDVSPGLNIQALPGAKNWGKMLKKMTNVAESKKPIQQSNEAEERRLAELRKSLDVKVNG